MATLQELNEFANGTVSFTDSRPSDVIFNFPTAVDLTDQPITAQSFTLQRTIDIVEIIQPTQTLITFEVDVSAISGTTVTFGSLPSGVTLTSSGGVFTISGIDSVSDWQAVRAPTITLPSAEHQGAFEYTCTISYTKNGSRLNKQWSVGTFKNIAELSSTSSLTCNVGGILRDYSANPIMVVNVDEAVGEVVILARIFVNANPVKKVSAQATLSSTITCNDVFAVQYASFSNQTIDSPTTANGFQFGANLAAHANETTNRIFTSPFEPGWTAYIGTGNATNSDGYRRLMFSNDGYPTGFNGFDSGNTDSIATTYKGRAVLTKYWGGYLGSLRIRIFRTDGGDADLQGSPFSFDDGYSDEQFKNLSGWASNVNQEKDGYVGGSYNLSRGGTYWSKIYTVDHSSIELQLKHAKGFDSAIGYTYVSENWFVIGRSGTFEVYDMLTGTLQRTVNTGISGEAKIDGDYFYMSGNGKVFDLTDGSTVTTLSNTGDALDTSSRYIAISDTNVAVYLYDKDNYTLVRTVTKPTTQATSVWGSNVQILDEEDGGPDQYLLVSDHNYGSNNEGAVFIYT